MLWAYSLSAFLTYILKKSKTAIFISSIFAILTELLQYFEIFNGTFDIIDILCEILAVCLSSYLTKKLIYEKNC